MALNYTTIFTHLGKIIARANSYETMAGTTLPADLLTLTTAFGTTWEPLEGVAGLYRGLQSDVVGWRQRVGQLADQRMADYDTVSKELHLSSGSGVDAVLTELIRQMITDNKYVKSNVVTIGSVSAAATNRGNGTAYVSKILDGYNSPVSGGFPHYLYNGITSELGSTTETMVLECISDSGIDKVTEGSEVWSWTGGAAFDPFNYNLEGSGFGPSVQTAQGAGIISNGDFSTWSSNVPSSWTLTTGTAGTHTIQESDLSHVYRGTSALKLNGTGAAMIKLTQAISPFQFPSRRRYFLGAVLKASGVDVGAARVRVRWSGSGYSAAAGELVELSGDVLPTSWTSYGTWLNMPNPMPSDWGIVIEAENLSNGVQVWLGTVAVIPATYHGGVAVAVTAGTEPWVRGDRLSFTVANSDVGKFQTFFRKQFRCQLPSVVSGAAQGYMLGLPLLLSGDVTPAATISDSLVV